MEKTYREFSARLENGRIRSTAAAWVTQWGVEEVWGDSPLCKGENVTNYYETTILSVVKTDLGSATYSREGWDGDKVSQRTASGRKIREEVTIKFTLKGGWEHLTKYGLPKEDVHILTSEYIV